MTKTLLPISQRPLPQQPAWLDETSFLLEAGAKSIRTENTYRSGLRLFADWLQHFKKADYTLKETWPLSPDRLTTAVILNFRNWLLANRAPATTTTYTAAILGYLNYLDGRDNLPVGVQLGKLQRQLHRNQVEFMNSINVIDFDTARQAMPQILTYYDNLPLPAKNDPYNRRLTLLRNRALVKTLYATAARISEVVLLSRKNVDNGQATYALITGKGGKSRTIHFRDYAQKAIQVYLKERQDHNPALFIAHSRNAKNSRLSITSVHKVVKKAVKALKLHPSLSAHDFRHYRATQLLREGMPIEVVQEFLGHSDISTTRSIYAPVLGIHIIAEWLDNVDLPPNHDATE